MSVIVQYFSSLLVEPTKLYTFRNNNNVTIRNTILTIQYYNLQFVFRQHYFTSHASINITENLRKTLDDRNIGCGVFVDLQKNFHTVDHQILSTKLYHY